MKFAKRWFLRFTPREIPAKLIKKVQAKENKRTTPGELELELEMVAKITPFLGDFGHHIKH